MAHPKDELVILTEEEMERKFLECGLPDLIKNCTTRRLDRIHSPRSGPPSNSVRHRRSKRIGYLTEGGAWIAFIVHWEDAGGDAKRVIWQFTCPHDGCTYMVK